jgi:hypothetical protein
VRDSPPLMPRARLQLDADAFARWAETPPRTVRRWLAVWHSLGVEGVTLHPSRGRYGRRYTIDRAAAQRWLRGDLPAPFASAAPLAA